MKKRCVLCGMSLLSLLLLLVVSQYPASAEGKAGYVGAEACKACHEDYFASYASSVHGKKSIKGGPAAGQACEACHGPGEEHVSKGGGKGVAIIAFDRKTDDRTKAAQCLSCHEESKDLAFWDMGKHKSAGVSCEACHAAHVPATDKLKAKENDVCFACHRDISAQFNKQSRHPVKEGLIKCSDCHDSHGGFGKKMIKGDEVNELCYKCHAEKRGPFFREHTPVAENCLNCHEAHGSNHLRLLTRKVPQLCQSCHDVNFGTHPAQPYTSQHGFTGSATDRNKMFGRGCLNCHTNIHGTNGAGFNGKMFLR